LKETTHMTLRDDFTRQMRQEIVIPDMERQETPGVVRYIRPAPGMSMVLYSCLNETNAEQTIEAQIEYFNKHNLPFAWKMYDYDTPPNLLDLLTAHGFAADPPDSLMVLEITKAPPILEQASKVDVRKIGAKCLSDAVSVLEQVWGGNFDWIYQRLGSHLEIPGYLSVFAVYLDNKPGCVGWIYYPPGSEFASLWGGSTVPELRSMGLYSAILSARVMEAASRGIRYLVTDASPMSKPVLEKHGFFQLATIYSCDFMGSQK